VEFYKIDVFPMTMANILYSSGHFTKISDIELCNWPIRIKYFRDQCDMC